MKTKVYAQFSQIISLKCAHDKDGRNLLPEDLSIIENASIAFNEKEILWVGEHSKLPKIYQACDKKNFRGHILLPEIVDSHTHLVFAGDRSKEYSMRLNGADYQEIAKAGGGILETMSKTITASETELFESAKKRIEAIKSYGVGSIEIKTGYGLTKESELKCCQVIKKLKDYFKGKVQIFCTYLAAHAVPKEYQNSNEYLNTVVVPLLKELSKESIIDFVDIFHEVGYFDERDTRELFAVARDLNIKTKIHADEFNDNGGASIATEYNSTSADHLLCTGDKGISDLSKSNTVATLLPGTAFFLGKPLADARKFLDAGCKVSIASDFNPGSCHCDNVILIASMAAKSLNMNICELWSALCLNSAHALGLHNQGVIQPGFDSRFSIFSCDRLDQITYSWGKNYSIT